MSISAGCKKQFSCFAMFVATTLPIGNASAQSGENSADSMSPQLLGSDDVKFTFGGYLREHLSFNLQDHPETRQNDKGSLSMARTTLQVEGDAAKGDLRLHAVYRGVREIQTDYLKRLEDLGAASGNLMYRYDASDLRELYGEFKPVDRVTIRLGKQQVVWGESDFFQAMDLVHGFDFTWRSFLEVENEDWRKPLILANAMIQVPEADGSLQFIVRPGWDRNKDIGSTYDLFGGRWANQPNKGLDFLPLLPYNYHHSNGDAKDVTGGFRWSGIAGPVNYSVAYLQTFGPNPVVNSAFAPYGGTPKGALGEFIYPKVDVYGMTLSGYSAVADAVFSAELAYTKDQLFNTGTNFLGGALPGFGAIKKKDTLRTMVRMDKTVDLANILGTSRPSFLSVQVFDTWLPGFSRQDDIVELAGYGAPKKEHSTLITAWLQMNYLSDRVNPMIALGTDASNGGWFVIPSVDIAYGDKWRIKAEADLFYPKHSKQPGEIESHTGLLGYFKNNNQFSIRVTRQF